MQTLLKAIAVIASCVTLVLIGALWMMGDGGSSIAPLAKDKTKPQGGVYTGCYNEPKHLNPFTTSGAVARRAVLRYTQDTLLSWDPETGGLRPALAKSYEFDTSTGWLTLPLRRIAAFSDGALITTKDLRFPFEVAQTEVPLGKVGDALGEIAEIDVTPQRFRMRLKNKTFGAVAKATTGYPIVQARFFLERCRELAGKDKDRKKLLEDHLASVRMPGPASGPYRVAEWKRGEELRLQQNPLSWYHFVYKDRWHLAGFRLLFVTDPSARFDLVRQGKVDWYASADVRGLLEREPALAESYRPLVYDQLGSGHFVLLWNHRREQLGKPAVRHALTMLFDRKAICEKLMSGQGKVPVGWCPPGSDIADPRIAPLPHDIDRARRLLEGAWPQTPRTLRIVIAANNPLQRRILEATQPHFEAAGITVSVEPLPWGTMSERLHKHDFDGILLHMSLDPTGDPFFTFHSSQTKGGHNFMGYRSADANRVLDAARAASDAEERRDLLRAFHRAFHRDQPVTLLAYAMSGVLLHKRFQDAEPNRLGLFPERWWVKAPN